MSVPQVLSFREFRENLAGTLRQVEAPDAEPVFVGRHRRAQAVVLSADRYARLVALERREAVADALASVRAEGLEPSPEGLALLDAVAAGELSTEQATAAVLARYQR
ncbi:MAG: type II toxin-antitoxin system Phd/YefM family antitoxin [Pseudonocardia sp.]